MCIKKTLQIVVLSIIICLFYACGQSRLEQALDLAGGNRIELQKVLDIYLEDPADSLKLRAAQFLIENMPGHRSFEGDQIDKYYARIDHLLDINLPLEQHRDSLERIAQEFANLYTHGREDVEIISAEYLIHNIEFAFQDWPDRQILKHITFEEFCEYLLPYKITDYQQLDYWKDSLRGRYSTLYNAKPWPPRLKYSLAHAANVINAAINPKVQERSIVSNHYPLLSSSNIDRLPFGICDDYSLLATAILRSEGIPCFKEDMMWIHKATGHSWHTIINNDGHNMLFRWGLSSYPERNFFEEPIAKVNRRMYSRNERIADYLQNCQHQAMRPDLFSKDVTSTYVATSSVSIDIKEREHQRMKWAYIAVFHNHAWEMIDFAKIRGKKAIFEDMGRNVVYQVFCYNGYKQIPIGSPFILHVNGDIEHLVSDKTDLCDVAISRKYPVSDHVFVVEQRMVGAKVEAANRSDFSDAVLIHQLADGEQYKFIETKTETKYRYWRYASAHGGYCDISELEFYLPDSLTPAKNKRIIGTLQTHHANPNSTPDKAFDADWLTSFSCEYADGAWLGLDFEGPIEIQRFRCVPRSDDNSIRTGDQYELFYWGEGEWRSLGHKIGTTHVLNYSNVPSNALLLLKNHTRGVDERIFTYSNGEQIWW